MLAAMPPLVHGLLEDPLVEELSVPKSLEEGSAIPELCGLFTGVAARIRASRSIRECCPTW